ncbi:hypothetical protein VNO77_02346 [Canavalia gladiata]|uniref:Uncharacterized protein n=1 Tax=Canavalia gladiata TaxID=3824 RepID=A0AAN9MT32_CANGL
MLAEIIDLTKSPPSPPRTSNTPRILNFDVVSGGKIQFEKSPISFGACENSNLRHTNQQQTNLWPTSAPTCEPTQIVNSFQPNMHAERVATVLEPLPEYRFPHGTGLKEPWTQREHELFLMGLIKYGKGRWGKISKHFLWNKTPEQIQGYATSFFGNLPYTYLHGFKRKKPTYSVANLMSKNKTLMDASTSNSIPMNVNQQPQQALKLFPEKAPFFPVSPYEEAKANNNNNNNAIMFGFQKQTNVASTSINTNSRANANGEVDLELRLG